ncbi:DUF2384 domain-containing protein [Microvirga sp. c23x22]|uniref:DUF2384 domain-containing protein n=1 Tax=Microvirga terricola TaxID=2719797 RepID=A0ABX0VF98_9HYPH|nr:DUF2384 domain-containing protein [Microvirga terricola]
MSENSPIGDADRVVVSKAAVRAAERLKIPDEVLARVLGIRVASLVCVRAGDLDLVSQGAIRNAILVVRIYQRLAAIFQGDESAAASWFNSDNTALGARPIDIIQSSCGLAQVTDHLETHYAGVIH